MKLYHHKSFSFIGLIATILLVVASLFSQVDKAVLFDRFDRLSCSDIRGRIDGFLAELSKNPAAIGVVVVGDDGDFSKSLLRRGLVETQASFRNFPLTRLHFVRKAGLPEYGVEFWKASRNADLPFSVNSDWSFNVPDTARPLVVYSSGFNESECYFPKGGGIIAEYLRANPGSRSNVVIRCNGRQCLNQQKMLILDEIPKKDDDLKRRIRFFHVPIRTDLYSNEFWLLP